MKISIRHDSRILSEQGLTQVYASKSVTLHLSFDTDLRGNSCSWHLNQASQ